jgi:hypothetical protein
MHKEIIPPTPTQIPTSTPTAIPSVTPAQIVLESSCKTEKDYDVCLDYWWDNDSSKSLTLIIQPKGDIEFNQYNVKIDDSNYHCKPHTEDQKFICIGPSQPVEQTLRMSIIDINSKQELGLTPVRFFKNTPTPEPTSPPIEDDGGGDEDNSGEGDDNDESVGDDEGGDSDDSQACNGFPAFLL